MDSGSEHSAIGSGLTMRNFQAGRPSLYDFEAELRELDVPVLLAVGDEDDPVIETNVFLKRVLADGPACGSAPRTGHGINLGRAWRLQPDGGGLLQRC